MIQSDSTENRRHIYTVSELTKLIKDLLEEKLPFVWISGEISNFHLANSGHCYFTLKDESAQISAVMFRGQQQGLKFSPENGMAVTVLGRLTVYNPRGQYQLIVEYLEPAGVGALQVAFEQLKQKLLSEGLFDEDHKKKIPFLPRSVGVITSLNGAVLHDILNIIMRRFPGMGVNIFPVSVQGSGAEREIEAAIELLNQVKRDDIAVLARGGGSMEDLMAFNSETVARALFRSHIPIVAAIGHETDFTIADFTADLRAPTPSAAAELIVPIKFDMKRRILELDHRLIENITSHIKRLRIQTKELEQRLVDPLRRVDSQRLRIDELVFRMNNKMKSQLRHQREHLAWNEVRLKTKGPGLICDNIKVKVEHLTTKLNNILNNKINGINTQLTSIVASLEALNPRSVLKRGYSITRLTSEGSVVTSPQQAPPGSPLEIIVAKGRIDVRVIDINSESNLRGSLKDNLSDKE